MISYKEQVKDLVKRNEMDMALKVLEKSGSRDHENEITMAFRRWNEVQKYDKNQTMGRVELNVRKNEITHSILSLADQIDDWFKEHVEYQNQSYISKRGFEINPEFFLGAKASKELGYNDKLYVRRMAVEKELESSILFNQNLLIAGAPGVGKSRIIMELIRRCLTKYRVVFPKMVLEDPTQFEKLKDQNKTIIIYDDLELYLQKQDKEHLEVISMVSQYDNLSLLGTFRKSERAMIEDSIKAVKPLFKFIEINKPNLKASDDLNIMH